MYFSYFLYSCISKRLNSVYREIFIDTILFFPFFQLIAILHSAFENIFWKRVFSGNLSPNFRISLRQKISKDITKSIISLLPLLIFHRRKLDPSLHNLQIAIFEAPYSSRRDDNLFNLHIHKKKRRTSLYFKTHFVLETTWFAILARKVDKTYNKAYNVYRTMLRVILIVPVLLSFYT